MRIIPAQWISMITQQFFETAYCLARQCQVQFEAKLEKPQPLSNEPGSCAKAGGKRSNICGKKGKNKPKT